MLTKERIKNTFSKCAGSYDKASDFQKETGYKLIERILLDGVPNNLVLDVGIGSGNITQELANRLNRNIHGCDIAWGMVSFSKQNTSRLFISQADAEYLPYKPNGFDIVFSNITYQWVPDFKKAFLEVRRVLKKGGRFYFAILVKDSLGELYGTLDTIFKTQSLHARTGFTDFLPPAEHIKSKLKESDFNIIWLEGKVIKRYYDSCLDLLRSLKMVGAGKILGFNLFGMGQRGLFFDMVEAYDTNFNENGKVFANYKVMMGCAGK